MERSSISYRPLAIPAPRLVPAAFTRGYTIDSLLGRWCPTSVWDAVREVLRDDGRFRLFEEEVRRRTTPARLARAETVARRTDEYLVGEGLVERDEDRIARWMERVSSLRDDSDLLERTCMSLDSYAFPYRYEDRSEVLRVWATFRTSTGIARRDSVAIGLFQRALAGGDLATLALDEVERGILRTMISARASVPR